MPCAGATVRPAAGAMEACVVSWDARGAWVQRQRLPRQRNVAACKAGPCTLQWLLQVLGQLARCNGTVAAAGGCAAQQGSQPNHWRVRLRSASLASAPVRGVLGPRP